MMQPSHRDLAERYRALEALIRAAVDAAPGRPEVERGEWREQRSAPAPECGRGRTIPFASLEEELRRVHRAEQARLLADAAELALTRPAGTPSDLLRPLPGAPSRRAWRVAARTELALAAADGLEVPRALSTSALGGPREDAPGAGSRRLVELASTALELRPGARTRLTLARVLVRVGREREALRLLSAVDAERGSGRGPVPPVWMPAWIDVEVERCRVAACERLGDLVRAGAILERVLASAAGDASDAALTLGLALVRGDEGAVRRAALAARGHHAAAPPATLALVRARLSRWRGGPGSSHASPESPGAPGDRGVARGREPRAGAWDRLLFELLCDWSPSVVAVTCAHLFEG